jgi:hypothetical protein
VSSTKLCYLLNQFFLFFSSGGQECACHALAVPTHLLNFGNCLDSDPRTHRAT